MLYRMGRYEFRANETTGGVIWGNDAFWLALDDLVKGEVISRVYKGYVPGIGPDIDITVTSYGKMFRVRTPAEADHRTEADSIGNSEL